MNRERIHTDGAPAAVGPYSQGISAGDFVYTAGQLGLDPVTGKFVSEDEVQAQTRRALQNVKAVLEAAGTGLENVVKTTVFLTDMDNFKLMNEVYAEFFSEPYPARSAVAVRQLPLGGLVEIEAVAVKS
ncbi:MAG: RidA family protein [Anaerolineae bacterium]|nr:RidA family protein [Anaerolineae bacterium]